MLNRTGRESASQADVGAPARTTARGWVAPMAFVVSLLCSLALGAGFAHSAEARGVGLARGEATLATPTESVLVKARLRPCQRGQRLKLRVGSEKLVARLPRAGRLRRRWELVRPEGRVRWRHRVVTRGGDCPDRLRPARLAFAPVAGRDDRATAERTAAPTAAPPEAPTAARTRLSGGPVAFGSAINAAALQSDSAYAAAATRFGSWTAENEMKMESLVPKATLGMPTYDFRTADLLVDRARAQGSDVYGHALVFKKQIPNWVRNWRWTRDSLRAFLRDYIQTVMGRYRGRVGSWDVVNEPLNADGAMNKSSFWYEHLGPSYIADAFHWAKAADPDAVLYLNEVLDVSNPIADGTYELVRELRAQGVPIEGVGFQTHVQADQTILTEQNFYENYKRFADLGVKVSVTEMDVETTGPGQEALQATVFGNAARACARVPACERFAVWGVTDRYGWLGDKAALPIDANYGLKPAWTAIADALAPRG